MITKQNKLVPQDHWRNTAILSIVLWIQNLVIKLKIKAKTQAFLKAHLKVFRYSRITINFGFFWVFLVFFLVKFLLKIAINITLSTLSWQYCLCGILYTFKTKFHFLKWFINTYTKVCNNCFKKSSTFLFYFFNSLRIFYLEELVYVLYFWKTSCNLRNVIFYETQSWWMIAEAFLGLLEDYNTA